MTVTTTHDPAGGGDPRLVFGVGPDSPHGSDLETVGRADFPLPQSGTTIGSDPSNNLCLPGLADFHAVVRRTDGDDYVLVDVGGGPLTRVHGLQVTETELHTGARIELGAWVLSYARDESADHGRPDGGRQGGELSAGPRVGA